jgi:hypothetical protein
MARRASSQPLPSILPLGLAKTQDVPSTNAKMPDQSLSEKSIKSLTPNNATGGHQNVEREDIYPPVTNPLGSSIPATDSLHFQPTFCGYLRSKKDALLLIECCMQGILKCSTPPTHGSSIRSGFIFVYHKTATGGKFTQEHASLSRFGPESNFVFESELGETGTLIKTTLEVAVAGYTVVSYHAPNEVEELSLIAPSKQPRLRGVLLRAALALQDPQSSLEMKIAV